MNVVVEIQFVKVAAMVEIKILCFWADRLFSTRPTRRLRGDAIIFCQLVLVQADRRISLAIRMEEDDGDGDGGRL